MSLRVQGKGEQSNRISALSALAVQFGRHTGAYATGSGITLILSLVQVAVVTRFLDPSGFGQLALLLFLASMLTIAYSIGSMHGTFGRVYGAAGDEDVDEDRAEQGQAKNKREALGTGIMVIAAVAALGTVLLAPLSGSIAGLLVGDSGDYDLVLIALVSGALGAVWRLVSNIPRMERQPGRYIWLSSTRAALVVAIVIPLVATGNGIEGILIGTAAGSALALVIGLYVIRESWVPRFDLSEAARMYRRSFYFVPIVISFWVVQNGDLFALSRYVNDADVGFYRLAGRIAALASYASSAFFLAWAPIRRGVGFAAAKEERGPELEGALLSYYGVFAAGILVAMTIGADLLVKIAPPAYSNAAPLVPLLGGAFVAHSLLRGVNRASSFPGKRSTFVSVVIGSVGLFLIAAMALIPRLGPEGAALAVIVAFLPGVAWVTFRNQFGPRPIALEPARLVALLLVTLAALGVARATADVTGVAHTIAQVGILLAFFPTLVLTGAVPRSDLGSLRRIASLILGRPRALGLEEKLPDMASDRAGLLWVLTRRRVSLAATARATEQDPGEMGAAVVSDLRDILGDHEQTALDGVIGIHLFTPMAPADHDANTRRVQKMGASAVDLGSLELAVEELTALSDGRWPTEAVTLGEDIARQVPQPAPQLEDSYLLQREMSGIKQTFTSQVDRLLEEEQSFGEHLRYVVKPGDPESNVLIFSFASTRPGTKDRYSWVSTLWDVDCHVVFVRTRDGHILGFDRSMTIAEESEAIQEQLRAELGVEKQNVITCGGSAGAVRALWMALSLGYGHAVLGAPLVRLGDFALKGSPDGARAKLARPLLGVDAGPDARRWLNQLILKKLKAPAGPSTLHVLFSERDQLYPYSFPALQKMCDRSPQLTLDLTMSNYDGHGEMRHRFRPYMREKLSVLVPSLEEAARRSSVGVR